MRIPIARTCQQLQILNRPLSFSYWPVAKQNRRQVLQSILFSADPWPIIVKQTQAHCPPTSLDEALALIEQSKDYFRAASVAEVSAAKPLLYYYAYMNLVKAFILFKGKRVTVEGAQHGFSERLRPGGRELLDAFLDAYPSTPAKINLFDDFLTVISGSGIGIRRQFDLVNLMPQIVPGHRLWVSASGEQERFISIDRLMFAQDRANKNIWVNILLDKGDLSRLNVSVSNLLANSGLSPNWRSVNPNGLANDNQILLEPINPIAYRLHPSEEVPLLIGGIKSDLWTTVLSTPPYRKYYLYLCPASERANLLPQLLAMYAFMYYLGSITRYRPRHFDTILHTEFSSFIQSGLSNQPMQFLFLMASEFAGQEVAKPSLV